MPFVDPQSVHNPTAGLVAPASWGDAVRDAVVYLSSPPRVRVYNSANISIPNGTLTALTFNSERFDSDTMHSTAANTGRITFTTAGGYDVGCGVAFAANATGQRDCSIRLNGTTPIAYDARAAAPATVDTVFCISTFYEFAAGDFIEVYVFQNSGAALNVRASGNISPEFWAALRSVA